MLDYDRFTYDLIITIKISRATALRYNNKKINKKKKKNHR